MLIVCKKCSKEFDIAEFGFVCNFCEYLNPIIPEIDYFLYLSMPCSLEVDQSLLETNYIKNMQNYHPDKYVNKTEEEQYYAVIHSSYLNTAYSTLKNYMDTVAYLYKKHNKEDIIQEEKLLYDNNLMMEFFDLYEEMSKITIDSKQDFLDRLLTVKNNLKDEIKLLNFSQASKKIQELYIKIRYLNTIEQKCLDQVIK